MTETTTPTRTDPQTPTRTTPETTPRTEPMRRMEPERVCPAQRVRIGETIRRKIQP